MVFTTSLDANSGFEDFEILSIILFHDIWGIVWVLFPQTVIHNAPNTHSVYPKGYCNITFTFE